MEVVAVEGAAGDALVLAFAALLQHHLQIVCTPCLFYFGGFAGGQPSTEPSSLCTVEPFSPGGLRRLALNVRSPLVRQMATIAFHGTSAMKFEGKAVTVASGGGSGGMGVWQAVNTANIRARDIALHIGLVMVQSGTWPIEGFDVRATLAWGSMQGLISGPRGAFVWPVPHDRIQVNAHASRLSPPHHRHQGSSNTSYSSGGNGSSSQKAMGMIGGTDAIAVWPRRVCAVLRRARRDDPSSTRELRPVLVLERWQQRDHCLVEEWHYALCVLVLSLVSPPPPPPSSSSWLSPSTFSLALQSMSRSTSRAAGGLWRKSSDHHDSLLSMAAATTAAVVAAAGAERAAVVTANSSRTPEMSSQILLRPLSTQRLLTYSPLLPLLALADALTQQRSVSRFGIDVGGVNGGSKVGDGNLEGGSRGTSTAFAIPAAASFLVAHDRIFGLSLFFGVPLVDRTRTLQSTLRCTTIPELAPPPPTRGTCPP